MKVLGTEVLFVDSERRVTNAALDYDDFGEITEVALISSTRGTLLSTLIQPRKTDTSDYSKLGYPTASLKAAPPLNQVCKQLKAEMAGKEVWCWNLRHESTLFPWMKDNGESGHPIYNMQCLMTRCAPYLHGWTTRHGCYKWPKQTHAAKAFGLTYALPGPHNAHADAAMLQDILAVIQRTDLVWNHPLDAAGELLLLDHKAADLPF